MRCRAAKVLRSTWAARTAISSSSSKAKSGTCFNSTGSHGIDHLVGAALFRKELRGTITDDRCEPVLISHIQKSGLLTLLSALRGSVLKSALCVRSRCGHLSVRVGDRPRTFGLQKIERVKRGRRSKSRGEV